MTGILIPEMVIYQTLENITKYIRDDLSSVQPDSGGNYDYSQTFLYRLLGLDDDGNPMKMNRYNYFIQAKKIFDNKKNLSVNIGYNFEVAKIISFHIILPSEQPATTSLGEDEGYYTEEDEESGKTQLKFCQMFSSTYQIMITSDNSSEVNLVYHIYKSLFVALVPHFSLKGLLNPKFSGNDIVFQDDTMPMGIFHKVLNFHFDYELIVPQLLLADVIKNIDFVGTPVDTSEEDEHQFDPSGKPKSLYPHHDFEIGRSTLYSQTEKSGSSNSGSSDNVPIHRVEPSAAVGFVKTDNDNIPSHEVEAGKPGLDSSNIEQQPSKIVEVGGDSSSVKDVDEVPARVVDAGKSVGVVTDGEDVPARHLEPTSGGFLNSNADERPNKVVEAGKSSTASSEIDENPVKIVEAGKPGLSNSEVDEVPSKQVEAGKGISTDKSINENPSRTIEAGKSNLTDKPIDESPSKVVEAGKGGLTNKTIDEVPSRQVEAGKNKFADKSADENPNKTIEAGKSNFSDKSVDENPSKTIEAGKSSLSNKPIDENPSKRVESGKNVNSESSKDDIPSKIVEAGKSENTSEVEYQPTHDIEAGKQSNPVNEGNYIPNHRVEAGKDALNVSNDELLPNHQLEVGRNILNTFESESLPNHMVERGMDITPYDFSLEIPFHMVEKGRTNIIWHERDYIPYHVIEGLIGENNTIHDIMVVVTDSLSEPLEGIIVELRSKETNYLYYAITDERGIARFPRIANETYTVTLCKQGVNMNHFFNIRFDDPQMYFEYSLVDKNIWDGMYADTHPIMYVDIWDGGYATQTKQIYVKDDEGNPLPNTAVEITKDLYDYVGVSNSDGIVTLNAVDGYTYDVLLAKSGVQQKNVSDWLFADDSDIIYPQEEKTTWDGMYATTDRRLYVDIYNGGNA